MTGRESSLDSELQPLVGERVPGESDISVLACNDFLRMGPGRKLMALSHVYTTLKGQKPPTRALGTLQKWSYKFRWTKRATEYDVQYDEYKTAMSESCLETGIALVWERVMRLKLLEEKLFDLIFGNEEEGLEAKLFLRDFKQTGSGASAEVHELERFNAPLIDQYRKLLDDISQEVGGRAKPTDKGSEDDPIVVKVYKGVSMEDL